MTRELDEGCDIAAVRALQRRLTRLRLVIMVPAIPLAFVSGALVVGLWAVFGGNGRDVSLPAMMLFGFAFTMGGAWILYRGLARLFAPRWVRELAREHGLSPEGLELTAAPYLRASTAPIAYKRWAIAAVLGFVGMLLAMGSVYFSVNG